MDQKSLAYFSSINPLARKIIRDEQTLRDMVGGEWDNLDWQKQEELLDDYLVDMSVREQYADVEKLHSYPPSFPSLKVESGEKIVVDFENDCWTWQDEHSSPFSWKTKSQQDLTLLDLEADQLTKPQPKTAKKPQPAHEEAQQESHVAPREFSVQSGGSIWESPFLVGMKKPDFLNKSRSQSPAKSASNSKESLDSRARTPEEVNYAFAGSCDDLSSSCPSALNDTDRSPSVSSSEILGSSPGNEVDKSKPVKRKRSLRSSPLKTLLSKKEESENGHTSLVTGQEAEEHAFDNPGLGNDGYEWSSFVNEPRRDSVDSGSVTASPSRRLLREPEPVTIDRGDPKTWDQTGLLTDIRTDFQREDLFAEEAISASQTGQEDVMDTSTSSVPKTGFGFLDDW